MIGLICGLGIILWPGLFRAMCRLRVVNSMTSTRVIKLTSFSNVTGKRRSLRHLVRVFVYVFCKWSILIRIHELNWSIILLTKNKANCYNNNLMQVQNLTVVSPRVDWPRTIYPPAWGYSQKNWVGCAAHFPKPLPYLWPKLTILPSQFTTLSMPWPKLNFCSIYSPEWKMSSIDRFNTSGWNALWLRISVSTLLISWLKTSVMKCGVAPTTINNNFRDGLVQMVGLTVVSA